MDLRITNTCNSNCLYCLEQNLRSKEAFVSFEEISSFLLEARSVSDDVITFYWGNPLIHPDIEKIVWYCSELRFTSISVLSNSLVPDKSIFQRLIDAGLTGIWIYFHSFHKDSHNTIVQWWISLSELQENIRFFSESWIFFKIIIHINGCNIQNLWKDVYILSTRFGCKNFEFINYFPFDRPYEKYRKILEYDREQHRENIDSLCKLLLKLSLSVQFVKFSQDFFWEYQMFYDFSLGIESQIWQEDRERIETLKEPFCLKEKRCKHCFIRDNCHWYAKRYTR